MIFVTVGTAHKPFDTLLKVLDAHNSNEDVEIIAQVGYSVYEPKYLQWFRFAPHDEMVDHISKAELVITHGGFAIISECLRRNKPILVIPRSTDDREAVNPQEELAEYLAKLGLIDFLKQPGELLQYLQSGRKPPIPELTFSSRIPEMIAEIVQQYLS